ncbi:MAG TPA: hypothetical protein VL418_00410 [Devosiaceae bacterium]|jgi:carboxymethylenebutenolidase|nr:hypothetical protein [Devosiaceae bacterium]
MFDTHDSAEGRKGIRGRRWTAQALVRAAAAAICLVLLPLSGTAAMAQSSQPLTVSFPSADGKTKLTGYLFAPPGRPKSAPAVVLLPGRLGAYSAHAKDNYSSMTLDRNIRTWADLWAAQGYWALVVDSFGPRGYPEGLPTSGSRPDAISETAVQPLDAYGALRYLRASPRIKGDRIALEGWGGGGSAALDSMRDKLLHGASALDHGHGFRAALSLFPDCGVQDHADSDYIPYAPVRIFVSAHEEKATTLTCEKLASTARAKGGDIAVTVADTAAPHGAADPAHGRLASASSAANRETRREALAFIEAAFGR